ncbi:hypothetical protein QBC43DRAFT_114421 [Cladorrhinum sp. PSN259]|nr:hypothetical protein QBC43DRAFT_114421 [Cladorrhinum sp. PSN259]
MDETQTSAQAQKEQIAPTATTRKRQIDHHHEPLPKRAQLTRMNLATFNKMGRKKSSDPSDESGSTKTTSTTSSGFAIKARNNGILEPAYSKPPANLEDIPIRQAKSRATTSPPESAYNDYVDRVEGAGNEATVVVQTSELLKKYPKGYRQAYNRAFTNLPGDVGFNNGLYAPQPDFVEGLEAEEYRPFPLDDYVPGAALYKDDPRSITLPQIAGEWKGPAGDMREARMQSAYDGAAMVHARTQAVAYMGKSDPPGHASITTFTTDGTNLYQYAHYAAPSDKDSNALEYHQFPISSMNLTGSYRGHKDGRRSLRNAQDYAKTQSEELRDQLREYWEQQRDNLQAIAASLPPLNYEPPIPTDACDTTALGEAYEDDDYERVEQPCQPTPAASTGPRKSGSHSRSPSKPHSQASKSHPPESSHSRNSEGKRKAPSSRSSHGSSGHVSKHRSYWKKDSATGRYYHEHSNGTKSWLDDEDEEDGY